MELFYYLYKLLFLYLSVVYYKMKIKYMNYYPTMVCPGVFYSSYTSEIR